MLCLLQVWFNNRALHAMPIFLNMHNNAVLRTALEKKHMTDVNPGAFGITLINHPMVGSSEVISMTKV